MVRPDTFHEVREHLAGLSDEQLKERFWQLANECVAPMVELARTHTSPSIERSVLMRMGIDSRTSMAVVSKCEKRRLLGHGAGHVVWLCMQEWQCSAAAAAARLACDEGWDIAEAKWGGAK